MAPVSCAGRRMNEKWTPTCNDLTRLLRIGTLAFESKKERDDPPKKFPAESNHRLGRLGTPRRVALLQPADHSLGGGLRFVEGSGLVGARMWCFDDACV